MLSVRSNKTNNLYIPRKPNISLRVILQPLSPTSLIGHWAAGRLPRVRKFGAPKAVLRALDA